MHHYVYHAITAPVNSQGSQMPLDMHDANEPNVLEPQHLPDTEILAEGFRGCLQVHSMAPTLDVCELTS